MRALRRLFDGTGLVVAAGAAFLALGILFAGLILAGGSGWQWFGGQAVHGREGTGVVAYSYGGHNYFVDDTNSFRTGPRTIWIDPSDPTRATLHIGVARISDSLFAGIPLAIGAGLVATGFWRRHQRSRRARRDLTDGTDASAGFGSGIDSATIAGIIGHRRPGRP